MEENRKMLGGETERTEVDESPSSLANFATSQEREEENEEVEEEEELTRSSHTHRTLYSLKLAIARSFDIDNLSKSSRTRDGNDSLNNLATERGGLYVMKRLNQHNEPKYEDQFDPIYPKKKVGNSQVTARDDASNMDTMTGNGGPRTKHDVMRVYYENVRQREDHLAKLRALHKEKQAREQERQQREKNEREYKHLNDFLLLPSLEPLQQKNTEERARIEMIEAKRSEELSSRQQKLRERKELAAEMYQDAIQRKDVARKKLESFNTVLR